MKFLQIKLHGRLVLANFDFLFYVEQRNTQGGCHLIALTGFQLIIWATSLN